MFYFKNDEHRKNWFAKVFDLKPWEVPSVENFGFVDNVKEKFDAIREQKGLGDTYKGRLSHALLMAEKFSRMVWRPDLSDVLSGFDHAGVYLIFKRDEVVYVGMSKNVSSRLEKSLCERCVDPYAQYSSRVVRTENVSIARILEMQLIHHFLPCENGEVKNGAEHVPFEDIEHLRSVWSDAFAVNDPQGAKASETLDKMRNCDEVTYEDVLAAVAFIDNFSKLAVETLRSENEALRCALQGVEQNV